MASIDEFQSAHLRDLFFRLQQAKSDVLNTILPAVDSSNSLSLFASNSQVFIISNPDYLWAAFFGKSAFCNAYQSKRADEPPSQSLQLIWAVKQSHIGDAFFDSDAASFLKGELDRSWADQVGPASLTLQDSRQHGSQLAKDSQHGPTSIFVSQVT